MGRDWRPFSAAALVTGAMVLVLVQLLNPVARSDAPGEMLGLVPGTTSSWPASSAFLALLAAALLVLGLPSVLSLVRCPRGRAPALVGSAVFGVGGAGVLSLATATLVRGAPGPAAGAAVTVASTLAASCLLCGLLLIAIGLSRSQAVAGWVPAAMVAFVTLQMLATTLPPGSGAGDALTVPPLLLLALACTGVATAATAPDGPDGRPGYAPVPGSISGTNV